MKIPLVVQVAANSLTEHLHVTLISRHGLLLAVLEQLLTQVHVQRHGPVVRALSQNRLLSTNSQGSGRVHVPGLLLINTGLGGVRVLLHRRQGLLVGADLVHVVHIAGTQQVLKRRTEVRQSRREASHRILVHSLRNNRGRHVLRRVLSITRLVLAVILHLLQLRYATVILIVVRQRRVRCSSRSRSRSGRGSRRRCRSRGRSGSRLRSSSRSALRARSGSRRLRSSLRATSRQQSHGADAQYAQRRAAGQVLGHSDTFQSVGDCNQFSRKPNRIQS
ncbi:hypothetical protein RMDY18_07970 [Rothia mucilaginosa DY-18]|uniref:Uncharacterized protein n=1 Tax=Rothia mucilaginosa (strain DY-18) TaxID=680646 RepID=D2NSK3_ROTMD|nr:hypothetical protein RMDY18_07970 [Rothia mucilaginosa DY-18]